MNVLIRKGGGKQFDIEVWVKGGPREFSMRGRDKNRKMDFTKKLPKESKDHTNQKKSGKNTISQLFS